MNADQKFQILHCKRQLEWAADILSKPNILYPSGKFSHDCAYEVQSDINMKLLDLPVFTAEGKINLNVENFTVNQ